ncbi:NADPH-dependent FMN reductase [Alkalibacillus aidingensis]|uniref:NADPH-dependent FMN reductase n=1 Tax=Alkalibacillus aidingensis TaxID=2747607 RepID=UPI001660F010|nr:NAD(P)H-dependent oxidoreductase [Alkalibacillus aidingensis]
MSRNLKLVGISGSLREDSVNKKLLDVCQSLLPDNVEYEYADYTDVPVFNQDKENPLPESVARFKKQVESADMLLIATPQYNGSFPGVLKNAIDWLTRPEGDNSLSGKVAGVVGATPGQSGTIQAQLHLREVLGHMGIQVPAHPRIMVSGAYDLVDDQGKLNLPERDAKSYEKMLQELVKLAGVR